MYLRMCLTRTILDYRPVVFLDVEAPYVELRTRDGRRAIAKVEKGPCIGVSRELAIMLYPYYGWGAMDVEAYFDVSEARPVEATRVVMKVPFGITEPVVRRQLTGFPIYEGTVALEYLDHVEFGEVVHVEPQPFAILTNNTALRLVEVPVEDDAVVFIMRGKRGV